MLNNKYKKQIEKVEEILSKFPEKCRNNFYLNLKTLKINEEQPNTNVLGNYNPLTNTITLYDNSSLHHELFHIAFHNPNSYGKDIGDKEYTDNGISIRQGDIIFGHALTEGFVEYLNRKCKSNKGKHFEYYFADLLISIYGEEILEYPLENNPIDFLENEKFNNILEYINNLDQLEELFTNVKFIAVSETLIKEAINKKANDIINNFKELIYQTKMGISSIILNLFNIIIDEFNLYQNPNISSEKFIEKIEEFCYNEDYIAVFRLSSNNNLKNDILNLRTKIKENIERKY